MAPPLATALTYDGAGIGSRNAVACHFRLEDRQADLYGGTNTCRDAYSGAPVAEALSIRVTPTGFRISRDRESLRPTSIALTPTAGATASTNAKGLIHSAGVSRGPVEVDIAEPDVEAQPTRGPGLAWRRDAPPATRRQRDPNRGASRIFSTHPCLWMAFAVRAAQSIRSEGQ